ncbi:VOC family protein [Pyxidicoccus parkwayensis]|jgi:PhnB protein|uniref:VOC family protein n=1 Tax=Pyxidicoccus parkwayensis TaxID=2813578 RepID=A0ABX7P0Z3_9BACT|nr:VOC family protein [Pyxidicoccus parkwaysis]QSQ24411.1 VOC family protein [Pyxidicoccus parkwaysis]
MAIHELFAYIRVKGAERAIAFYVEAFGAKEKFRLVEPNGRVGHCELELGKGVLMLSEEFPEYGILGPQSVGGASVTLHLHVDNADALIDRAVTAGATVTRPPQNHFYGERSGSVRDPFGHEWSIGHEVEHLSPEEMQRRYTAMFSKA